MEATDEKVYDSTMMKRLVKRVWDNHDKENVKIKSVLSDGVHDSNENFKFPNGNRIKPAIKVKGNSIVSPENSKTRNGKVRRQAKDFQVGKGKKVRRQVDC